jgi:hypothetical protein
MADQKDGRSQNQPSHDAQVKGGQHSHGGNDAEKSQPDPRTPTVQENSRPCAMVLNKQDALAWKKNQF